MGRLQALYPAAFLVNQHWRVGMIDGFPELPDQAAHLIGVLAVAFKQDKTRRKGLFKETPFVIRQGGAGAAENHRLRRFGISHVEPRLPDGLDDQAADLALGQLLAQLPGGFFVGQGASAKPVIDTLPRPQVGLGHLQLEVA